MCIDYPHDAWPLKGHAAAGRAPARLSVNTGLFKESDILCIFVYI